MELLCILCNLIQMKYEERLKHLSVNFKYINALLSDMMAAFYVFKKFYYFRKYTDIFKDEVMCCLIFATK